MHIFLLCWLLFLGVCGMGKSKLRVKVKLTYSLGSQLYMVGECIINFVTKNGLVTKAISIIAINSLKIHREID